MTKRLIVLALLLLEIAALAAYFYCGAQANQYDPKGGNGDLASFSIWNGRTGIAFLVLAASWVLVVLIQLAQVFSNRSLAALIRPYSYSSPEPWALLVPLVGVAVNFLFFTF